MRGGAPSKYSGPLPLSWRRALGAACGPAPGGGGWAVRRGEGGTADTPLGRDGTRSPSWCCVAKAVPEISYRLPICANAVGRQITLFKGEFFVFFFLSTQHRQTFSSEGAVEVFVRRFWRSSFNWPFCPVLFIFCLLQCRSDAVESFFAAFDTYTIRMHH